MVITDENLYTVLMALKDAGVVRARFGDVELDFAPEVTPPAVNDVPRVISITGSTASAPQTSDFTSPTAIKPGYSRLFGANPPRFSPAELPGALKG